DEVVATPKQAAAAEPPPVPKKPEPVAAKKAPPPAEPPPKPAIRAEAASPSLPRPAIAKPLASPAVRRRARDAGIDLRQVRGSGPAGRVGHEDLDAFLRGATGPAKAGARGANSDIETVKVIGLRRRIAQKMAESKR